MSRRKNRRRLSEAFRKSWPVIAALVVGGVGGRVAFDVSPDGAVTLSDAPAPQPLPPEGLKAADLDDRMWIMVNLRNGDHNDPVNLRREWTPRLNTVSQQMAYLRSVVEPYLAAGVRGVALQLPAGSPDWDVPDGGEGERYQGRMTASHFWPLSPELRLYMGRAFDEWKRKYPGLQIGVYAGWWTDPDISTVVWEGRYHHTNTRSMAPPHDRPFYGPDFAAGGPGDSASLSPSLPSQLPPMQPGVIRSWYPDIRDAHDRAMMVGTFSPLRQWGMDVVFVDAISNQSEYGPPEFGHATDWVDLLERETGLRFVMEGFHLEKDPDGPSEGRGDGAWQIDMSIVGEHESFGLGRFVDRYGWFEDMPESQIAMIGINGNWPVWKAAQTDEERVAVIEGVRRRGCVPVLYVGSDNMLGVVASVVGAEGRQD